MGDVTGCCCFHYGGGGCFGGDFDVGVLDGVASALAGVMAKQPDMNTRMLRELIDKVDGLAREAHAQRDQLNVCITTCLRLEQVLGRLRYDVNDVMIELGVQRRRLEALEEGK